MKKVLIFLFCAAVLPTVAAQDFSGKNNLAVLAIDSTEWDLSSEFLDKIDLEIEGVLEELESFNVTRLNYRMYSDGIFTADDLTPGIGYRDLNEETGTDEANVGKLSGFDIIIAPALSFYDSSVAGKDSRYKWKTEVQVSFFIIRNAVAGADMPLTIKVFGSGESHGKAVQNAVEALRVQFALQIRTVEGFQIDSGVIEVMNGGQIVVKSPPGIKPVSGDEFHLTELTETDDGRIAKEDTGLVMITGKQEPLLYGLVIYNDGLINPGDHLEYIPKFGTDVSFYSRGLFDSSGLFGGVFGTRVVLSKGVWELRPAVGTEISVVNKVLNRLWPGMPLSIFGGGELMWYIGRIQIESSIMLGTTWLVPVSNGERLWLTHIDGTADIAINWMLFDNFRLYLEGGYTYRYSIAPEKLNDEVEVSSFGGIFGGLGVTFKL